MQMGQLVIYTSLKLVSLRYMQEMVLSQPMPKKGPAVLECKSIHESESMEEIDMLVWVELSL